MPAITKLTKSETISNSEPHYFTKEVYDGLVELDYHNYPYIAIANNGDVYAIEGYSDGSGCWYADRFVVEDSSVSRSNVFKMISAAKNAFQRSPSFRTRKELINALEAESFEWKAVNKERAKKDGLFSPASATVEEARGLADAGSNNRGRTSKTKCPLSESLLGYLLAGLGGAIAVQWFFFLSPLFLWLINWDTKRRADRFPKGGSLEAAKWVTWAVSGAVLTPLIWAAIKS